MFRWVLHTENTLTDPLSFNMALMFIINLVSLTATSAHIIAIMVLVFAALSATLVMAMPLSLSAPPRPPYHLTSKGEIYCAVSHQRCACVLTHTHTHTHTRTGVRYSSDTGSHEVSVTHNQKVCRLYVLIIARATNPTVACVIYLLQRDGIKCCFVW
jgi:hypothetical protein